MYRSIAQCFRRGARHARHDGAEVRPKWLEEVLAIVSLQDKMQRVKEEGSKAGEKLMRMAKTYVDNLFPDEEYHRQKRLLEMELESRAVPQANAAEEAGNLIQDSPKLWSEANLAERRKLLLTMLDAVYVDAKQGSELSLSG